MWQAYLGEDDADEFNVILLDPSLGDGDLGHVGLTRSGKFV